MIHEATGWYIYCSPCEGRQPTDLWGPFNSLHELEDWLMDNGIQLRDLPPPDGGVRYFTEMADDDLSDRDYAPWACSPHRRG